MCGIALQFKQSGEPEGLTLDLISHRGPDSRGEWRAPHLWLGHTRLAIVDLSPSGAQPMTDPRTGNVIIFNGEIYNHLALRKQLGNVDWQGTCDTETLLVAYRQWGAEMLGRLKGMFAFVIFDAARRGLFIARDRLGIKPLYYLQRDGELRIASETRVLRDRLSLDVTREAVSAYLALGAAPQEMLLHPDISLLLAGHYMSVTGDAKVKIEKYWPPPRLINSAGDPARRVRELLEQSVEEHLLADVPVASFLSGGIDSSAITALAAQRSGGRLQTFSIGFHQEEFDETAVAAQVAKRFSTRHHRIELSDDEVLRIVPEAVEKLDLPSVDAINTYIIAKKVAEAGIKCALCGLGGDELFGGYPSFRDVPKLQRLAQFVRWARPVLPLFGARSARIAELPSEVGEMVRWRRRVWTDRMLRRGGLPIVQLPMPPAPELPDDFAEISWGELTGYMHDMLLRDTDQMSMAVSLELRVPFLDHELVEYVLGLPAREKHRFGGMKGLLVESCRDLLPENVYARKKMGFVLPMDAWMRGPLKQYVSDGLQWLTAHEIVPEQAAIQTMNSFQSGRLHWAPLWTLVVLGHYLRENSKSET